MIDLTNFVELQMPIKKRILFTYYIQLDKKTMLNILQSDVIYIDGTYFKTPDKTLLKCLMNKKYGKTKLILERHLNKYK